MHPWLRLIPLPFHRGTTFCAEPISLIVLLCKHFCSMLKPQMSFSEKGVLHVNGYTQRWDLSAMQRDVSICGRWPDFHTQWQLWRLMHLVPFLCGSYFFLYGGSEGDIFSFSACSLEYFCCALIVFLGSSQHAVRHKQSGVSRHLDCCQVVTSRSRG